MPEKENVPAAVPETAPAPKRKRLLLSLLIGAAAVLAALVLILLLLLNWSVASAVRSGAPMFTGTPVELKSVSINPFSGRVQLNGFKVANPPGFGHPYAFELDHFVLDVDMGTVFSRKLVFEEVTVKGMLADYELGTAGSNLAEIQRNVEKAVGKSDGEKAPAAPSAETTAVQPEKQTDGRQIVIRRLQVSKLTLAMGSLKLQLPPVAINDLGDGHSMERLLAEFYRALMKDVTDAIASHTAKSVGESARGVGKSIEETGKKVLGNFRKMFQQEEK